MTLLRPARLAPILAALLALGGLPIADAAMPTSVGGHLAPLDPAGANTRLTHAVYGYLPYWEVDEGTDAYLRYELLSTIAFFGAPIRDNGSLNTSHNGYITYLGPLATTIIEHAHAAGVRTDLTITSFGFDHNARFFSDPVAQQRTIDETVALVGLRGADGVNVDVESLSGVYFDAYGAFVGALRAALVAQNPAASVTVATNANTSGARMAKAAIDHGADLAFVMGYAYRSAGSDPVGNNGPLVRADGGLSLSGTLDYYTRYGVPFDRLILGLPYYGYSWPTTTADLNSARQPSATYGGGVVFLPRNLPGAARGATVHFDPLEASSWYARWDFARQSWIQAYFDDARSLIAKYRFAAERGLAGAGMWALGYDKGVPGYWEAIDAAYGVYVGPRPLSATVDPNPVTALDVQVAVTWEDGTQPATELRLSNDELTWSEWLPIAPSVPWQLAEGPDAPRTVSLQLRDGTGVESWVVRAPADLHVAPRLHVARIDPATTPTPTTPVTLTLEWEDGAAPVTLMRLSDDGTAWTDWLPITASTPWTLTDGDDGPRSVSIELQDATGVVSQTQVATARVDRAPILGAPSVSPSSSRSTAVTFDLAWSDFGDAVTQVRLQNVGQPWSPWMPASASLPWTLADGPDGVRQVRAQVRDAADNRSQIRVAAVTLQAAPVLSAVTVTPDPTSSLDVSVALAWQPDGNPPTQVRLSDDGLTWSEWRPIAAAVPWTLAAGPPGERTVSAQLGDAIGNCSAVASDTVTLEPAPSPPASLDPLQQEVGTQVGQVTLPVMLRWSAPDPDGALAGYELQGSTDGTAWVTIGPSPTTATSRSRSFLPGHLYRFQVRTINDVGTNSAWASRAASVVAYTESSSAIAYTGAWTRRSSTSARGGVMKTVSGVGAVARLTFTGRTVAWIAPVGPDRGQAEVRVDGVSAGIVDLYAGAASARRVVFSHRWASWGTHTLEIRVLATPGRPRVDVDGFGLFR